MDARLRTSILAAFAITAALVLLALVLELILVLFRQEYALQLVCVGGFSAAILIGIFVLFWHWIYYGCRNQSIKPEINLVRRRIIRSLKWRK